MCRTALPVLGAVERARGRIGRLRSQPRPTFQTVDSGVPEGGAVATAGRRGRGYGRGRGLECDIAELQEQVAEHTRAEAASDRLAQECMAQVAQLTGLLGLAEQAGTAANSQGAHAQVQWDSLHRFMFMVHGSFMEEYRKPAAALAGQRSHCHQRLLSHR